VTSYKWKIESVRTTCSRTASSFAPAPPFDTDAGVGCGCEEEEEEEEEERLYLH